MCVVAPGLAAQGDVKKKKTQVSHKKPTPEQIRKFKELEKKQKKG
jgi:hypothetical protein